MSQNWVATTNAITNKLVAWKHGHIVAAMLSRAQLWQILLLPLITGVLAAHCVTFEASALLLPKNLVLLSLVSFGWPVAGIWLSPFYISKHFWLIWFHTISFKTTVYSYKKKLFPEKSEVIYNSLYYFAISYKIYFFNFVSFLKFEGYFHASLIFLPLIFS